MNAGENALRHGLGPWCPPTSEADPIRRSPRFDMAADDKVLPRQRLRGECGTSFGRRFVPPVTAVQIGMERNRGVNDPVCARRTRPRERERVVHTTVPGVHVGVFVRGKRERPLCGSEWRVRGAQIASGSRALEGESSADSATLSI